VEIQRWAKVSAGDQHTCGIATSGELFCWGEEANGRLGAASVINNRQPVLLEFHDNWLDVAAGGAHSCGIQDDGQLFCWGLNASGQLGTGNTDNASSPQSVALQQGLARWTAVTAGSDHTCALGERGNGTMAAYCWGAGGGGRLGNSQSSGTFNTPQEVGGSVQGNDVHTISAGDEHTCATLTFSGQTRTYCWGNGSSGRLGNGLTDVIPSPDRVSSVDDYQKVTSGEEHSCGVRSDGSAYCWGENIRGQLGTDGSLTLEPEAVVMPAGVTLVDIEAGPEHTCGIGSNGRMYCWGRSDQNRLSLSDGQPSSTPGLVAWPRGEHIPE
jgi:alpha-tubulin suppressor-like RCC1 family protein